MFRKVAPWYAKRFGPAKPFNNAIVQISTRDEFETVLVDYLAWRSQFTDATGNLQPQYELEPLMASFMKEPQNPVESRKSIPVPKGRWRYGEIIGSLLVRVFQNSYFFATTCMSRPVSCEEMSLL